MEKWLEDIKDKPVEYLIDYYVNMRIYSAMTDFKAEIEKSHKEYIKAMQLKEIILEKIKYC